MSPSSKNGHPKKIESSKFQLTADPIPEDGPLTASQSMMLCAGCVRCCTYVSVEVDPPVTPWQYDQYVWLLYHANVWMYLEVGNRWFVQFETRCEKLSPQGHCTVHGRHPALCKDYDPRSCERRAPMDDLRARFHDGEELLAWLEKNRPVQYRRYRAWFEKVHAPKQYANAPARVRDTGAPRRGNLAKPPKPVRFEMPPPPVNPLLFRTPATRVAYRKVSGPQGNGPRPGRTSSVKRPRRPTPSGV
ncbi:MAG: hypothetical protein ACREOU_04920 [Candidatus Eiseniibacteriota bacterium]